MKTGTATVLFTDLVGSTETSTRLGPAEAERLRRVHDSLLVDAVAGHGGTTVKGLGDGIMATFPAASEAVAAAVTIQQAAHRQSRRSPEAALSVRVGMSAGDVTFENDDCFGPPVVEAARLCATAEGGHILASDLVRVLSRGLSGDRFHPAGRLTLKGLSEPVDAVEVVWDLPAESRTPLPARLAAARSFVGRSLELDTLDAAFKAAVVGDGRQVVLIAGEPGVGKSALIGRAVRSWHEQGASVGVGCCDEDLTMPYQPISDALTYLVRHAPLHVLTSHVGRHGGAARHVVPTLTERLVTPPAPAGADPEAERYLTFAAVVDLLRALGEDSPVVLVLEDLHWADGGTLALARHLAVSATGARLLVIGTFRDSELTRSHPLSDVLATLRRQEGVVRLGLEGLDDCEVAALLAARAGHVLDEPGEALARQLTRETDGNPFYVSELLRHLVETGQIRRNDEGRWDAGRTTTDMALPESIREVVGARVARLGPAAVDVLTTAAVIGNEFDVTLLCAANNATQEDALAVLDAARSAALVKEHLDGPGRFAFSHALVHRALLQEAGATRCALLHRRVAVALEGLVGPGAATHQAELAHHWSEASRTTDAARARDYAMRAAEHAVNVLAPGEASRWYDRALELHSQTPGDDPARRADLLTALGIAQQQAGDAAYRATLLEAARTAFRLGDPARLTAAVLASNRGTFSAYGEVDDEKVAMLEAALASIVPDDERRRCQLLATLASELTYSGDYRRRRALADEAVGTARTLDDPAILLRVLNLVFHPIWLPETLHERLAMSAESVALAQVVGDPVVLFWCEHRHFINLMQAGLVDDADRCLAGQWDFAERLGQPLLRWSARYSAAGRKLFAGDPDGAEELAQQALVFGRDSSQPEVGAYYLSQMMSVRWQQGRANKGINLDSAVSGSAVPSLEAALALALADAGQSSDAAEILGRGTSDGTVHMPRNPAYLTGVTCLAEVAIRLGDATAAGPLYDALSPWRSQIGFDAVCTVGPLGHFVAGLAALLGRHSEAEELFEETALRAGRLDAPFFRARALLEWGRMLLARSGPGDRERARDHLATARAISEGAGYTAVARRAGDLIALP